MSRYGVTIFPTDYSIQPVELARAVEERGFDSIFVTEHTHIPANRRTPWPGGTDLPKDYWHTHDPLVALAAMAAVTDRVKLGTGVCLVVERDPIQLAKEVASLDMISKGRVILGVGAGWNAEEMENHGVEFSTRWKLVREKVLAMKTIWSEEEPEYHGEFVNFDKLSTTAMVGCRSRSRAVSTKGSSRCARLASVGVEISSPWIARSLRPLRTKTLVERTSTTVSRIRCSRCLRSRPR
jgi:probable F420-dependent oxidoreductase